MWFFTWRIWSSEGTLSNLIPSESEKEPVIADNDFSSSDSWEYCWILSVFLSRNWCTSIRSLKKRDGLREISYISKLMSYLNSTSIRLSAASKESSRCRSILRSLAISDRSFSYCWIFFVILSRERSSSDTMSSNNWWTKFSTRFILVSSMFSSPMVRHRSNSRVKRLFAIKLIFLKRLSLKWRKLWAWILGNLSEYCAYFSGSSTSILIYKIRIKVTTRMHECESELFAIFREKGVLVNKILTRLFSNFFVILGRSSKNDVLSTKAPNYEVT